MKSFPVAFVYTGYAYSVCFSLNPVPTEAPHMTIRNSFLAILAKQPAHGYALKSEFEDSTAGTWPMNVGQVYTTLSRLERDGLVEAAGAGERSRQLWKITTRGRRTLTQWYRTPVVDEPPARDELALKVLLAVAADSIDVGKILDAQRVATMKRLQELTKAKREADPDAELAWVLMLDSLILKLQAEAKWLDHCEATLRDRGRR